LYYDNKEDSKDSTSKTEKEWKTSLVELTPSEAFKLQYEEISANIRSRDNMSIVGGTILVTASILLLTSAVGLIGQGTIDFNIRVALVLASLAIYSIWMLGFDLTTDKVNDICYSKLREMEMNTKPRLNIHSDMRDRLTHKKWYKYVRRNIWLYLLWVLILLSIVILEMH
jgi:hypothetical protein